MTDDRLARNPALLCLIRAMQMALFPIALGFTVAGLLVAVSLFRVARKNSGETTPETGESALSS